MHICTYTCRIAAMSFASPEGKAEDWHQTLLAVHSIDHLA